MKSLNILCVTHADFETPGVIETWAHKNHHRFKIEKPYKGETLSDISPFDLLIVMGGPQSSVEIEKYPYLALEIELIKSATLQNKKILGFCLGTQLIGEALDAKASRSPEKEVGVYPIHLTAEGMKDPLFQNLPKEFPVIHWHNDMPGLTNDSVVLASSLGCPRQIVRYKKNIYGFQCHLEITLDGIRTMVEAVPDDLKPSTYTQSKDVLLRQDYDSINNRMITILNRFSI